MTFSVNCNEWTIQGNLVMVKKLIFPNASSSVSDPDSDSESVESNSDLSVWSLLRVDALWWRDSNCCKGRSPSLQLNATLKMKQQQTEHQNKIENEVKIGNDTSQFIDSTYHVWAVVSNKKSNFTKIQIPLLHAFI